LTTAAFEAHWSMIHGHAFRLVRNETSADDLAQEAFVRLWEAERQNRWPDVPPAWLATVVSNLAISGFRQSAVARRRAIELTQVGSGAGHDDVRDTEFRADAEAIVIRALDRLSADSRRAVVLAQIRTVAEFVIMGKGRMRRVEPAFQGLEGGVTVQQDPGRVPAHGARSRLVGDLLAHLPSVGRRVALPRQRPIADVELCAVLRGHCRLRFLKEPS
jgi:RNA polymerase sigma factor (sigma-70 family)